MKSAVSANISKKASEGRRINMHIKRTYTIEIIAGLAIALAVFPVVRGLCWLMVEFGI